MSAAVEMDDVPADERLVSLLREPIDPRTVPVRFSRLKNMAKSPAHYLAAVQEDADDSLAMRLGRGVHAMLLGMPVVKFTGKQRRGKDWDSFKAANADKEILNANEWAQAEGMSTAVHRHRQAHDLLFAAGVELERTIEWELNGRKCTSRPDSRRTNDLLVDLKTTRCSEPRKFSRDAQFMGYHAQFSFYGEAIRTETGRAPKDNYVVAIESKRPYVVTVLEVVPRTIAEGEKCWRLWWERLAVCEAANEWPGYTQTIEPFDLSDDGDTVLIVDGEEMEL
ncbi:MAG TPA: PD-(D/E)XK nuclease-like domain-containing protein [Kofleriaceae bacterium]|jgi:hypothetical protein